MNDNKLDPISAPSGLGTSSKINSGVKKLNKLPLIIIGLVAFILILGLGFATIKRGEIEEGNKVKITHVDNDGEKFAGNMLNDLWQQSLREKKRIIPKQKDINTTKLKQTPIAIPKPLGLPLTDKNIDNIIDKEALKLEKLKKARLIAALNAPTKTKKITSLSNFGVGRNNKLNTKKDAASKLLNTLSSALNPKNNEKKVQSILNQKNSFEYLPSRKTPQLSPYEIKTGTLIPGVMISGINSDLPGVIKGQVRENVYDTATGEYLLIPQGSTLIGKYSSKVRYGQDRVLIAWNRLIFPDGKTLDIGSMNGMDAEGYAGYADDVDNHYFQVFGSALLLTVLNGDITYNDGYIVIKSESTDTQRKETAIEKAASKIIEKQLGIAPTITIRPGYRFNIFVTKDIILDPLKY